MAKSISFTIKFWRQNGPKDQGHFDSYEMKDIPDDTSFLEMLDILNECLINEGKEPFVFDHDCREGICGMCSLYINGTPHGLTERGATTCQLYMRERGAHQRRQGALRIRSRLPRGYLRYVLALHQWYASRTHRAWRYYLSALHASLQRW